jgi:6-phosphogluconate dehydrogenase (decarboxylating)
MKIALIGYGKMGQAIEEIALQQGHEIVLKINIDNTEDLTRENLSKALQAGWINIPRHRHSASNTRAHCWLPATSA